VFLWIIGMGPVVQHFVAFLLLLVVLWPPSGRYRQMPESINRQLGEHIHQMFRQFACNPENQYKRNYENPFQEDRSCTLAAYSTPNHCKYLHFYILSLAKKKSPARKEGERAGQV
jgi:hypothetical protein